MLKLNGIGVSEGIAFSKVFIYKKENPEIVKKAVKDTEAELTKFKSALDESEEQLDLLYKKACEELGEEDAGIFTAHKMFLEDPEFVLGIRENINSGDNAEFAVKKVADSFIESFSLIDDEYIRERIADIKDVSERLIKNIMGIKEKSLSDIEEECIIVAYDLTPSDTAAMNKEKIKGFITQIGGKTSHTSIIAKTIGIPAVVGVDDIFKRFKGSENIILDGFSG
ncbi:MAG TPA: phosphoenolpyruvate-utilizing N-terminal domain-containing protein, partial [Tepiditoga sp.]|nr:phosphoenolpyruvate-utilizing N-terminal domain-containing protein [Tepiditoga sp.]